MDLTPIHKEMYFHIKRKALSYEGPQSPLLKKYKKDFLRFSKRDVSKSNLSELIESTLNSNVVYFGDFHAFDQSTKNIKRIMGDILKRKKKIAFALESLPHNKTQTIKNYINNEIDEEDFLKQINYHKHWKFPWAYTKFFFELAKTHQLTIIGLNSKGNLYKRDQTASQIISSFIRDNPQSTLFVIFGEYHVVVDKIPLMVNIRLGTKLIQTIIHQNLDQIYWKHQNPIDKQQIFKFNNCEFSLQTAPPWIKYDSACKWYEGVLDDPNWETHEFTTHYPENDSLEIMQESFLDFAKKISYALSLDLNDEELTDFNLYDHTTFKSALKKIRKIRPKNLKNFYLKLLTRSKTFKLPFSCDYYCPGNASNRIAYLAGIHVLHKYYLKRNPRYEWDQLNKLQTKKFIFFMYRHLMAFYSSKIINPYRKCDYYQDIANKLNSKDTPKRKKTYLQLAISILDNWENFNLYLSGRSLKILSSSAKLVGYLLGEYLFEELMMKQKKSFEEVKTILLSYQNRPEDFKQLARLILENSDYKKQKKRFL